MLDSFGEKNEEKVDRISKELCVEMRTSHTAKVNAYKLYLEDDTPEYKAYLSCMNRLKTHYTNNPM